MNRYHYPIAGCGQIPGVPQPVIPGYVAEGICTGMRAESEAAGKRRGLLQGLVSGAFFMATVGWYLNRRTH